MVRLLVERKISENEYGTSFSYYYAKNTEINKLKKDGLLANNLRANIINNNLIISYNFKSESCELEWKDFLNNVADNFIEYYLRKGSYCSDLLLVLTDSSAVDFDLDVIFQSVCVSLKYYDYYWCVIDSKKQQSGYTYSLDKFISKENREPFENVFISQSDFEGIKELAYNAVLDIYNDFKNILIDTISNEYYEDPHNSFSNLEDSYSDDEHKIGAYNHYLGKTDYYDGKYDAELRPEFWLCNGKELITYEDNLKDAIKRAEKENYEKVVRVDFVKSSVSPEGHFWKNCSAVWENPNYVPEPKKKTRKRK